MGQDFSWDKSAVDYVKLYSEMLGLDYRDQLPKPELAPESEVTNLARSKEAIGEANLPKSPLSKS
jgi:starch synthase